MVRPITVEHSTLATEQVLNEDLFAWGQLVIPALVLKEQSEVLPDEQAGIALLLCVCCQADNSVVDKRSRNNG